MKPYHRKGNIVLYHADARDLLPRLTGPYAVVTDPVWPNGRARIAGKEDAAGLLTAVGGLLAPRVSRLVLQLGCDTDPRLLATVPAELPYLRTCWLDYAVPSYKGRILYSGDVAHCFGRPTQAAGRGRQLLPGRCVSGRVDQLDIKRAPGYAQARADRLSHPCPRRFEHVLWLVHWFSDPWETVLDPFAGSGTTLLAARELGRAAVGVEIEERFCEVAAARLDGRPATANGRSQ